LAQLARAATTDIRLKHILPRLLKVRAGAYLSDAAKVRHEHDWAMWPT
jgi:hypothetical protein